MRIPDNLLVYVVARCNFDAKTGCWNWNGTGSQRPIFTFRGKSELVYRKLWEYLHPLTPLRSGDFICHHCDNGLCCNPDHLFLGTVQDNNQDAVRKGRHIAFSNPELNRAALAKGKEYLRQHPELRLRGDNHPFRKRPELVKRGDSHWTKTSPHLIPRGSQRHDALFNDSQVEAIRADKRTLKEIAKEYNCHYSTIGYIRQRKHYGVLNSAASA